MNILLNNRPTEIPEDNISIPRLLKLQKFTFKMLIIKINDKLIPRDYYTSTFISDSDKVDVIHLISGG